MVTVQKDAVLVHVGHGELVRLALMLAHNVHPHLYVNLRRQLVSRYLEAGGRVDVTVGQFRGYRDLVLETG